MDSKSLSRMVTPAKKLLASCLFLLLVLPGCVEGQAQPASVDCSEQSAEAIKQNEADRLLPVRMAGKWGFIDKTGKLRIKPQFAAINEFSSFSEDRMAIGGKNGKWGFIDRTGRTIVEPRFENVGRFINQRAAVKLGGKWGFIDQNGKVVITPQFTHVVLFLEKSTFVQMSYLWGIIDINGNWLAKPRFNSYTFFAEGLAAVSWSEDGGFKTGFVDQNGKIVVELNGINADTESLGFSNGLIPIWADRNPIFGNLLDSGQTRNRRIYGFADLTGNVVISPKYDFVFGFKDCLAPVELDDKWGLINTKGEIVIKPQSEDSFSLRSSEGLIAVKINQKYGYLDKAGTIVIAPQFQFALPFSGNLARVQVDKKGRWGFVGRDGKFVIEPKFDTASDFRDGVARVEIAGKVGYIDKTGKYIWVPTK